MAARLTDKQKKKIVADYVELNSYNAVAKINGVSRQTVKNIVEANGQIGQKLQDGQVTGVQPQCLHTVKYKVLPDLQRAVQRGRLRCMVSAKEIMVRRR